MMNCLSLCAGKNIPVVATELKATQKMHLSMLRRACGWQDDLDLWSLQWLVKRNEWQHLNSCVGLATSCAQIKRLTFIKNSNQTHHRGKHIYVATCTWQDDAHLKVSNFDMWILTSLYTSNRNI